MKVKVYVDWYDSKIINEKEFKEKVEEATKEYKKDEDFFDQWLNKNYSADEIWKFDAEQRKAVQRNFLIKCEELGDSDTREDWEEKEIEI